MYIQGSGAKLHSYEGIKICTILFQNTLGISSAAVVPKGMASIVFSDCLLSRSVIICIALKELCFVSRPYVRRQSRLEEC